MMLRRKEIIISVLTGSALILTCLTVALLVSAKGQKLFTVDGMIVTEEELNLFAVRNRAAILNEYAAEAENTGETFWNNLLPEGKTPVELLRERCTEQLIEIKTVYRLAQERGIDCTPDYHDIQVRFTEENKRREASLSKDEPVYGQVAYTLSDYYFYMYDQVLIALKNQIIDAMDISEEEYIQYYNAHKTGYMQGGGVVLETYRWSFDNQVQREAAWTAATHAAESLKAGHAVGEESTELILGASGSMKKDMMRYPRLFPAAIQAVKDQVIGPMEEQDEIYVVKCLEENVEEITPYENVREEVVSTVKAQCFSAFLEQECKKAEVTYTYRYKQWTFV